MILTNEEVNARLSSADNLVNRLRSIVSASSASSASKTEIPSLPNGLMTNDAEIVSIPSIDDLVDNTEDKVNAARSHSLAQSVLKQTLQKLEQRLIEVDNPVQLSRVATDMGKLINGFDEHKPKTENAPIIIWKPTMNSEVQYGDVIHANE